MCMLNWYKVPVLGRHGYRLCVGSAGQGLRAAPVRYFLLHGLIKQ